MHTHTIPATRPTCERPTCTARALYRVTLIATCGHVRRVGSQTDRCDEHSVGREGGSCGTCPTTTEVIRKRTYA